jgi:hypothetical protein
VQDGCGAVAAGEGKWKDVNTNSADGLLNRAWSPEGGSDGPPSLRKLPITLITDEE